MNPAGCEPFSHKLRSASIESLDSRLRCALLVEKILCSASPAIFQIASQAFFSKVFKKGGGFLGGAKDRPLYCEFFQALVLYRRFQRLVAIRKGGPDGDFFTGNPSGSAGVVRSPTASAII